MLFVHPHISNVPINAILIDRTLQYYPHLLTVSLVIIKLVYHFYLYLIVFMLFLCVYNIILNVFLSIVFCRFFKKFLIDSLQQKKVQPKLNFFDVGEYRFSRAVSGEVS